MTERQYTLSDAARIARGADGERLAAVSLRAAIHRGYLHATKRGKVWYVNESELRRYLKDRPRWFKPRANAR